MGLRLDEFEGMTVAEFYCAYTGYIEKLEYQKRQSWEQTRIIYVGIISPFLKSHKSAHDLLPFSWDNENADVPEMSTEERIERVKKIKEFIASNKK